MVYSFNYWIVFAFTWFITPWFIEFVGASDFTVSERITRAMRNTIPFTILYILFFVVVILIMAFTDSGRAALQK